MDSFGLIVELLNFQNYEIVDNFTLKICVFNYAQHFTTPVNREQYY